MKTKICLASVLLTCFIASSWGQVGSLDSLQQALNEANSDTLKSSILIELAKTATDESEQLSYAAEAYAIGKDLSSPKHKYRSTLALGIYYYPFDVDSSILLIQNAIKGYSESGLTRYEINGNYILGATFELESELDSAIKYLEITYELGQDLDVYTEYANAAYELANIHNIRGNNVEALKWAQLAKNAFEKEGLRREVGQTLNQIGIIYDQKGLYSEALDNYLNAREIAIQAGDVEGEIFINNNIGVIYDNMNNTEMALSYYNDGLEKARIHDSKDNEATLLNNLSYVHLSQGDTLKAKQLLWNALAIDLSDIYPCFESYPLEGLGDLYLNQDVLDSAEHYLNKALTVANACEDAIVISTVYKGLGQLNAKLGKRQVAESALMKSLGMAKQSQLQTETKNTLQALYEFHIQFGNSGAALRYMQEYIMLTDSISEQNNIEKASQLASEYEFRKQVAIMDQERLASEKKFTEEIQAKTYQNRLILLALFLFLLLAGSLARSYYLIQKRNKKLRWLNDEKNKLMGIVAHDLRNPLNMILGLMPLLESDLKNVKDKNIDKYLELLNTSTDRMRDMIDRVLDISAIENMKVNLKREKTDLSQLTSSSIHNFDVIAGQKRIKIVDNIDQETERHSIVDPNYLVQVIDNLLSNAIKFSDQGKNIEVSLTSSDGHHEIAVKDEGPGIPESEQKNLFKAFTTLSSKPTAQERSTGLGLSIAYKFVKAMGGEIECESQPGDGTTFRLVFAKA